MNTEGTKYCHIQRIKNIAKTRIKICNRLAWSHNSRNPKYLQAYLNTFALRSSHLLTPYPWSDYFMPIPFDLCFKKHCTSLCLHSPDFARCSKNHSMPSVSCKRNHTLIRKKHRWSHNIVKIQLNYHMHNDVTWNHSVGLLWSNIWASI